MLVLMTEVLFCETLTDLGSAARFVSSLDAPREGSSFAMLEDIVGLVLFNEGSSWTGDCGEEAIAGGVKCGRSREGGGSSGTSQRRAVRQTWAEDAVCRVWKSR